MLQNLKTGSILLSKNSENMLKITKAQKPVTSESIVTVANVDESGKAVRGTAKQMKADSLRRRYTQLV